MMSGTLLLDPTATSDEFCASVELMNGNVTAMTTAKADEAYTE